MSKNVQSHRNLPHSAFVSDLGFPGIQGEKVVFAKTNEQELCLLGKLMATTLICLHGFGPCYNHVYPLNNLCKTPQTLKIKTPKLKTPNTEPQRL